LVVVEEAAAEVEQPKVLPSFLLVPLQKMLLLQ
jgi:hypothetical protein